MTAPNPYFWQYRRPSSNVMYITFSVWGTGRVADHGHSDERVVMRFSLKTRAGVVIAAAATVALAACGSSGGGNTSQPSGSSGGGGSSAAATGTPIKIGSIGQYSGVAGDTSKATADTLVAWSKYINAQGGIHGHPVQVIVKDDAADAAKSVAMVKDLVENDHVIALVGNHESGLEAAWAKYVDAKQIPVVGGVATGATYNSDPNFFPVGNTGITGFEAYINAAKLFGGTVYSQVVCAEFPACKQADALMAYYGKAMNFKTVASQAIAASAPSYAAQCAALKGEGADAVFTASSLDVSERFIQQCATQGYKPLYIDNPQNWKDDATTNPVWEGAVLASDAPLWFGDGPGTADYLAAMKQYAPNAILNASGTNGWFSGELLKAALDKAFDNGATGDVTSQMIYDGLYALGPNFDLGGAIAPVTFTKGKPMQQQLCAWYAQVKDGKLTAPKGYKPICLEGVEPPSLGG